MTPILSCRNISISFGATPLFSNLSLVLNEGDRIGIIGPNGAGKSTLLKVLAGMIPPDSGERSARKLATAGYLAQDSLFPPGRSVYEWVRESVSDLREEEVEKDTRSAMVLSQAGFRDFEADAATLSGGWRKRLAIARELARRPDVLLLDEPTNHLDIEGIEWLEDLLLGGGFAFAAVSHDRYFLENVCSSVAEVSRVYPDGIFRNEGGYSDFLEKREEFLAAQAKHEEALATKVRREVEWLRRGAKARTIKSKSRIGRAYDLMEELDNVSTRNRSLEPRAGIDFSASGRQTKKLLETRDLARRIGGRTLFEDVNLILKPGIRIGLIGPNGSGKTTLLEILAGEQTPDSGVIERAEQLSIVYFDQERDQPGPGLSLRRALAPEGDSVFYRGQSIHVHAWARRFLFQNEQLEMPVSQLSGGERARVLIARLMTRQADLLLLDEPTNDLDIPTLEVLEESLSTFPGAVVLVTHDRYLLDRVTNAVVAIHGDGRTGEYADYHQWEADRDRLAASQQNELSGVRSKETASEPGNQPSKRKLSFKEKREWESMEEKILEAEQRLKQAEERIQARDVVADQARLRDAVQAMEAIRQDVEGLYARWAELETSLQ